MKKITRPKQREEATYYSDFSGECLGEMTPHVEVRFDFCYGSKFDGSRFELHLSDNDAMKLLDFLKTNLTADAKKELAKNDQFYKMTEITNILCNDN
jgi:hypothetical protein